MKKFEGRELVVGYYQGDSRCFEFASIMAYRDSDELWPSILMKELEEEDIPRLSKFFHVRRVGVY